MKETDRRIELLDNHILTIKCDESEGISPNIWEDQEVFLVYDHRQFDVRRNGFEPADIYYYTTNKESEYKEIYKDYHIFKLYAHIHSGVVLYLNAKTGFDISNTGYVIVKKDTESTAGEQVQYLLARQKAECLLHDWNKYLSGEVYEAILSKKKYFLKSFLKVEEGKLEVVELGEIGYDEEEVSCIGGYYGLNIEDMLGDIPSELWNEEILNREKKK